MLFEIMFYIISFFFFGGVSTNKLNIFLGIIYSEICMIIQCNNFLIKKICSVRTIRPSSNHVYFVYYYTYVCNLTLKGIFFSKT